MKYLATGYFFKETGCLTYVCFPTLALYHINKIVIFAGITIFNADALPIGRVETCFCILAYPHLKRLNSKLNVVPCVFCPFKVNIGKNLKVLALGKVEFYSWCTSVLLPLEYLYTLLPIKL